MFRGQRNLLNGSLAAKQLRSLEVNSDTVKRISKIKGFTLAEVLITLAIIGVVAAMTMPVLIAKYQEHVTVNKVKKWYSMMSQAVMLAINENGYPEEWNISDNDTEQSAKEITSYIKPYLKVAKDCGVASGCVGYPASGWHLLNGTYHVSTYDKGDNRNTLILNDGSVIFLAIPTGTYCTGYDGDVTDICGAIYTDINGPKAPNTWGKDIFSMYITKTGPKTSAGNNYCYMDQGGWDCSGYIIQKGNMNYPARKPTE